MKRKTICTLLVLALTLPLAAPAFANDTALGSVGGTVAPQSVTGIRLQAETIQATVYGRFAEYRVDFQFDNQSAEETTVLVGFPFLLPNAETPGYMPAAGFRAWANGTPLAVKYVEGKDGPLGVRYYTHEVTFRPGTTRVTVDYLASPSVTVATQVEAPAPAPWSAVKLHGLRNLTYWVHTGSGWSGTIGTTLIRYTFAPGAPAWGTDLLLERRIGWLRDDFKVTGNAFADAQANVLSTVTQPAEGVYQWRFSDYEPTPDKTSGLSPYDISLPYYEPVPVYGSDLIGMYPGVKVSAESSLKLGEYSYPAMQAVDGQPDTAWAEGVSGSGIGQTLTIEFAQPRDVAEVRVVSGYAKRPDLFSKYNRPRTLEVTFNDGTKVNLDLEDQPGLQRFPVSAKGAASAVVRIADVYRGTTRDETYLSEIEFASAAAPDFESFESLLGLAPQEEQPPAEESATPTATPATITPASGHPEPATSGTSGWLLLAAAALAALGIAASAIAIARRKRASATARVPAWTGSDGPGGAPATPDEREASDAPRPPS